VIDLKYVQVSSLDYDVWRAVTRLYLSDPLKHAYLMYDLIYELDTVDVHFQLSDRKIIGYLLIWKGLDDVAIHIWGNAHRLIDFIPVDRSMVIQVYSEDLVDPLVKYLKSKGNNVTTKTYLNMVVDKSDFKPYSVEKVLRLGEEDLNAFIEIKKVQGKVLSEEKARDLIKKWRYYGLYVDDKLVAIACAYLRMNEIWIVGDVFTHPDYRGKGYAKMVTSAVTKDAVTVEAKAFLHVKEDNIPAIKVYKALGYKILDKRTMDIL